MTEKDMPPRPITDEELTKRLRAAGLRLTPQRLAVYRVLVNTNIHPTAAQIFTQLRERMPSISQATVYNTLQVLVNEGLVHEVGDAGDGSSHYDADITPHVNLVCRRCQRITDFHDPHIAGLDQLVARNTGYSLLGARLVYYGLCPGCQAAGEKE